MISSAIGDVSDQLMTLARQLDVPVDEVVEAVSALLDFNDHNSAKIIWNELDERDVAAETDAMARALLSDIEAALIMMRDGMDSNDLRLLLVTLRDRVMLRMKPQ